MISGLFQNEKILLKFHLKEFISIDCVWKYLLMEMISVMRGKLSKIKFTIRGANPPKLEKIWKLAAKIIILSKFYPLFVYSSRFRRGNIYVFITNFSYTFFRFGEGRSPRPPPRLRHWYPHKRSHQYLSTITIDSCF